MAILSGAGAVLAVETQASGTIDVDALADLGAAVIILDVGIFAPLAAQLEPVKQTVTALQLTELRSLSKHLYVSSPLDEPGADAHSDHPSPCLWVIS